MITMINSVTMTLTQALPTPNPNPNPKMDFATQVATMPSEQQKVQLGERLFSLIEKQQDIVMYGMCGDTRYIMSEHAREITDMLLEMDTPKLLRLIHTPRALRSEVSTIIQESTRY